MGSFMLWKGEKNALTAQIDTNAKSFKNSEHFEELQN